MQQYDPRQKNRLIAIAFELPRKKGQTVDHIDNNRSNNALQTGTLSLTAAASRDSATAQSETSTVSYCDLLHGRSNEHSTIDGSTYKDMPFHFQICPCSYRVCQPDRSAWGRIGGSGSSCRYRLELQKI